MSWFGNTFKDNLANDIQEFIRNNSIHELMEMLAWIFENTEDAKP